jgi:hypothetical protein
MINLFFPKIKMESKQEFFNIIHTHYTNKLGEKLPHELLKEICENITEYYYEQYKRFRSQYPKSIKRYSSFKIKDLEHPEVYEMVIKFFKVKKGTEYSIYTMLMLNWSLDKLKEFEKQRANFHNM